MRALGIIPARSGSKRLLRKNMRLVGGRALVARTIDSARAATSLAHLVVSSDDPDVLELAGQIDPSLPLTRPSALASDTSEAIDYVRHALNTLDSGRNLFDVIVILQPSSPFTTAADIDGTVALLGTSGADSAVSVVALDHAIHPLKLKRMAGDGRLLPHIEEEHGRMAAHQLPQLYVRNGSVYASRRAVIDGGEVIGADCRGYAMPRERSVDINDELDLRFAEFLEHESLAGGDVES